MGVVTAEGEHLLIDSGPLPEAVAASAAIPIIFQAVDVPGKWTGAGQGRQGTGANAQTVRLVERPPAAYRAKHASTWFTFDSNLEIQKHVYATAMWTGRHNHAGAVGACNKPAFELLHP